MLFDLLPRVKGGDPDPLRLGLAVNVGAIVWVHVVTPATVALYEHFYPPVLSGTMDPSLSVVNLASAVDPVKARLTLAAAPPKVSQPSAVLNYKAPFALAPAPPNVLRPPVQVPGEQVSLLSTGSVLLIIGLFIASVILPIVFGLFVHQNVIASEPSSWPPPPLRKPSLPVHPLEREKKGNDRSTPKGPPPPPPPPPPGPPSGQDLGPRPRPIPIWLLWLIYLVISVNAIRVAWAVIETLFPRQVEAIRRRVTGAPEESPPPPPPPPPSLRERLMSSLSILVSAAIASQITLLSEPADYVTNNLPFLAPIARYVIFVAPFSIYIIAAVVSLSVAGLFLYSLHQRIIENAVAAFGEEDEKTMLGTPAIKKKDIADNTGRNPEREDSEIAFGISDTRFGVASPVQPRFLLAQSVRQHEDEEEFFSIYGHSLEIRDSLEHTDSGPATDGDEIVALTTSEGHRHKAIFMPEGDPDAGETLPIPEDDDTEPLPTTLSAHVDSVDLLRRNPPSASVEREEVDYSVEYIQPTAAGNFSALLNDSVELLRRFKTHGSIISGAGDDNEDADDASAEYPVRESTSPFDLEPPTRSSTPPIFRINLGRPSEMPMLGGGRRTIEELEQIFDMYAPRPVGEEPPSISDSMIQNYSMTSSRDGDWETSLADDRVQPYREGLDRSLDLGLGSAASSEAHVPAVAPSRPSSGPGLQPLDLRLAALLNESKQQLREADEKFREAVLLKRKMAQIYGIDESSKSLPNDLTPPAPLEVNVVPPTPPVGRPVTPPPPTDELPQFLEFAEPDSVIFANLSSPSQPSSSVLPRFSVKSAYTSPITREQISQYDELTDASLPSLPPLPPLSDDSQDLILFEQAEIQAGHEGGKATQLQADDTFEIPLDEIAKWENLCGAELPLEPDDSADWKLTEEMKQFWAERTARKAQEKLDKEAMSRTSKEGKGKGERGKGKENLGVERLSSITPSSTSRPRTVLAPKQQVRASASSSKDHQNGMRGREKEREKQGKGKSKEKSEVERRSVVPSSSKPAGSIPRARPVLTPMRQATASASKPSWT